MVRTFLYGNDGKKAHGFSYLRQADETCQKRSASIELAWATVIFEMSVTDIRKTVIYILSFPICAPVQIVILSVR